MPILMLDQDFHNQSYHILKSFEHKPFSVLPLLRPLLHLSRHPHGQPASLVKILWEKTLLQIPGLAPLIPVDHHHRRQPTARQQTAIPETSQMSQQMESLTVRLLFVREVISLLHQVLRMPVGQPQEERGEAIMQILAVASRRHQQLAAVLVSLVETNQDDRIKIRRGPSVVHLEVYLLKELVRRSQLRCFQRRKACSCFSITTMR